MESLQKLYIDVIYFLVDSPVLQEEVSFKSLQDSVSDFEPEDHQGIRLYGSSQPLLEVWEEQLRYRHPHTFVRCMVGWGRRLQMARMVSASYVYLPQEKAS